MSYFVNNVRRFARELMRSPGDIPARVGGALKVKLVTGSQELLAGQAPAR